MKKKYYHSKYQDPQSFQYKSKSSRRRKHKNLFADLAPVYRNAVRIRCAQSISEKWLFKSESAAKNAIEYNAKSKRSRGKPERYERAYYCSACNGYHITSMDMKQWGERKRELWSKFGLLDEERENDWGIYYNGGGFSSFHKKSIKK